MQILGDLDFEINVTEIGNRLGISSDSGEWPDVRDLVEEARGNMHPRAAYRSCFVRQKAEASVTVEDVPFQSKVLRKNLEEVERVFPFVVTLGQQLDDRLKKEKDFLKQYYMDIIANVALQDAIQALCAQVQDKHAMEKLSYMNPGSLQDWPIDQQAPLFRLLGNVEEEIGVRLSPSMLMYPSKTESGILFPTEVTFFNCQLCPNENCPSRKAEFDEQMARDYGIL